MKRYTQTEAKRFYRALYVLFLTIFISFPGFSQNVGINSTGAAPNPNAGLDVDFTNMGLLIPRVALTGTASFAPLSAHVAGMIVYNTATAGDVKPGFYYNDGAKWITGFPAGSAIGDMLYWNGTSWNLLPVGTAGQYLTLNGSNTPFWATVTPAGVYSTLTTTAISAITTTSATSGGTIVSDGGSAVLVKGVCWATTTNPTTANSITSNGAGNTTYSSSLTGLAAGTIYFIKAYSINNSVVSYGNELSFYTLANVTTTAASLITSNSARSGGNVTSGNASVIERGVCYATTTNPTTANLKVVDPSPGAGAFISDITGLTENTLYYVRSYVTNASGTSYGNQITITTLPTLTTTAISSITMISASSGGTIAVGGNASITVKGVCWSTSPNPTTALTTKTSNGTGTGVYTSSLTPLIGGTTYYVRAYATNAGGTSYGNELSFTTLPPVLATLTTTAITNITVISASGGGNVTDAGGTTVTSKGICWSTSPSPTTANFIYTYPAGGTGSFPGTLSGLSSNTLYYVRAWATNSVGTAYGNEVTFTTCTTPIYSIGQSFGGGTVFYVDCTGSHGLIMATSDQSAGTTWGCSGTAFNTSSAVGTGSANTTTIANGCATVDIAAKAAKNYTGGGFNDWYLPSSGELALMVNSGLLLGGTYWSSTDNNSATVALIYYYGNNWQASSAVKTYTCQVRAIRTF